ncbi:MAG: electron transfer flavoprotein subunit beta/FixA family protein [Gemmatimonadales bacterium]|jgi:electron transfer flavoprotein beta subunit
MVKIAVCIKRVPDSETRIKIGTDGKSIDESGVKFVLNPFDEYAVEEALKLKEHTNGDVVAISLGPESSQETIRSALAMGADRGVLLKCDSIPLDPLPTARALAAELEQGAYDIVFFGKLAIDNYDQAVGTMVAELLGIPSVSAITRLEVTDQSATVEREIEGAVEVVEFSLPAVVTAEKGLNEPRYPALRGIMLAKKKPLDVKDVDLSKGGLEVLELSLPSERKAGRIVGEGPEAVPALVDALQNEAKVL